MTNNKLQALPYTPEYIRRKNFLCVCHPELVSIVKKIESEPGLLFRDSLIFKERPNLIARTSLLPAKDFFRQGQVVKKFRWRGSQGVFSSFKKSKAMKSFEAACHLMSHDLATPLPLAVIENRFMGFIKDNIYICEAITNCIDWRTYKKTLPQGEGGMEKVIISLAEYALKMHDSGLWHRDFNLSNFLFRDTSGGIKLYLVDLNRARIVPGLSDVERAMDLSRLELKRWQRQFFELYCGNRFDVDAMLAAANKLRFRRKSWRQKVVWSNPIRRKLGLK